MSHTRSWALTGLVLAAAASRLAPHPDNVTPVAAVALFGAATFAGRFAAVVVPLLALLLSDLALHATYQAGWQAVPGFYPGQWVVYACILATVGIGFRLRRRRTIATVALATFAGASLFFLLTNFVYFYGPDSLHPRTLSGLLECYRAALPFFRNSLAGDFFYSTVLFGSLAMAEARFPMIRRDEARLASSAG